MRVKPCNIRIPSSLSDAQVAADAACAAKRYAYSAEQVESRLNSYVDELTGLDLEQIAANTAAAADVVERAEAAAETAQSSAEVVETLAAEVKEIHDAIIEQDLEQLRQDIETVTDLISTVDGKVSDAQQAAEDASESASSARQSETAATSALTDTWTAYSAILNEKDNAAAHFATEAEEKVSEAVTAQLNPGGDFYAAVNTAVHDTIPSAVKEEADGYVTQITTEGGSLYDYVEGSKSEISSLQSSAVSTITTHKEAALNDITDAKEEAIGSIGDKVDAEISAKINPEYISEKVNEVLPGLIDEELADENGAWNTAKNEAIADATEQAELARQWATSDTHVAGTVYSGAYGYMLITERLADQAQSDATKAADSASSASSSASEAWNSKEGAAAAAMEAAMWYTSIYSQAQAAKTAQEDASYSAQQAASSASSALASKEDAATSASNAEASATNAAGSASDASDSAEEAATSETNAAQSAEDASDSAGAASVSAREAATSATNAAQSAEDASDAAHSASVSYSNATNAAASADSSKTLAQKYQLVAQAFAVDDFKNGFDIADNGNGPELVYRDDQIGYYSSAKTWASTSQSSAGSAASAANTARNFAISEDSFEYYPDKDYSSIVIKAASARMWAEAADPFQLNGEDHKSAKAYAELAKASETNAAVSANSASTSASDASGYVTRAESAMNLAEQYAENAASSVDAAEDSAEAAANSAANAAARENLAERYMEVAEAFAVSQYESGFIIRDTDNGPVIEMADPEQGYSSARTYAYSARDSADKAYSDATTAGRHMQTAYSLAALETTFSYNSNDAASARMWAEAADPFTLNGEEHKSAKAYAILAETAEEEALLHAEQANEAAADAATAYSKTVEAYEGTLNAYEGTLNAYSDTKAAVGEAETYLTKVNAVKNTIDQTLISSNWTANNIPVDASGAFSVAIGLVYAAWSKEACAIYKDAALEDKLCTIWAEEQRCILATQDKYYVSPVEQAASVIITSVQYTQPSA